MDNKKKNKPIDPFFVYPEEMIEDYKEDPNPRPRKGYRRKWKPRPERASPRIIDPQQPISNAIDPKRYDIKPGQSVQDRINSYRRKQDLIKSGKINEESGEEVRARRKAWAVKRSKEMAKEEATAIDPYKSQKNLERQAKKEADAKRKAKSAEKASVKKEADQSKREEKNRKKRIKKKTESDASFKDYRSKQIRRNSTKEAKQEAVNQRRYDDIVSGEGLDDRGYNSKIRPASTFEDSLNYKHGSDEWNESLRVHSGEKAQVIREKQESKIPRDEKALDRLRKNTHKANTNELAPNRIVFDIEGTSTDVNEVRLTQFSAIEYKDGIPVKGTNIFSDPGIENLYDVTPDGFKEKPSVSFTGQNKPFLDANGAIKEVDAVKKMHTFFTENHVNGGKQVVGQNLVDYDIVAINKLFKRYGLDEIKFDYKNIVDTKDASVAAILDISMGDDENIVDFRKRMKKFNAQGGWTTLQQAEAYGIDVDDELNQAAKFWKTDVLSLHDGRGDVWLEHAIASKQNDIISKERIRRVSPEIVGTPKQQMDAKVAAWAKGPAGKKKLNGFAGMAVGAAVAVGAITMFGRSAAEESYEKLGGPKDNPYADIAAIGLTGLASYKFSHQAADAFAVDTSLKSLLDGSYFDVKHMPKSSMGKFGKYAPLALIGYSILATGSNVINDDDGDSFRYASIAGGVGAVGLVAGTTLQKHGGSYDAMGYHVSEAYKKTMTDIDSDDSEGVFKIAKNIKNVYKTMADGNSFRTAYSPEDIKKHPELGGRYKPQTPGQKNINGFIGGTIKNNYARAAAAIGVLVTGANLMSDVGDVNAVSRHAGSNGGREYNSQDRIGYRSVKRYIGNYKSGYNQVQPHGMALV